MVPLALHLEVMQRSPKAGIYCSLDSGGEYDLLCDDGILIRSSSS